MARSSKKAKEKERRRNSLLHPYKHISYDPDTGVFTITVRGTARTATSDALALWTRDQMLAEHGDARECLTCANVFLTTSANQLYCSLECKELVDALRAVVYKRQNKGLGPSIERYLYYDTSSYVARPYDMRLRDVLKRRFKEIEEARAFIRDVMNSTRPWRVRSCTSCGRTFDPYEQELHLRSRKCSECGGERTAAWGGGKRRSPLVASCEWCGDEMVHYTKGRPTRFCDSCVGAVGDTEQLRQRRRKFLSKT